MALQVRAFPVAFPVAFPIVPVFIDSIMVFRRNPQRRNIR
jgi:hypothetical protein